MGIYYINGNISMAGFMEIDGGNLYHGNFMGI